MKRSFLLCLALLLCAPASAVFGQQAEDYYKQYKEAYARNDLATAVDMLCKAAKLDPQSYGKQCESAQQYYNSRLQKFESYYVSGKAKFDARQYADAISDLSRIDFGPRRAEAQQLIAQANEAIAHPQPADNSPAMLKAAQQAFESGDFTNAEANALQVKAPELQPQAQAILNNIRNYRDDMQQAEAFLASRNYTAAEQKYMAALKIRSNGPGDPAGKLAAVPVLMKQQNNNAGAAGKPADTLAKINSGLAEARDMLAKKNWQGALSACNQVLVLDPRQNEAANCREKAEEGMKAAIASDPKALEDTLVRGVRDYYESHLDDARDAISLYLTAGGTRSKGAAYFYLGATMLSQAILADPKGSNQDSMRQNAMQQFRQAKQQGYKPVEKYVSPRILAAWNQSG